MSQASCQVGMFAERNCAWENSVGGACRQFVVTSSSSRGLPKACVRTNTNNTTTEWEHLHAGCGSRAMPEVPTSCAALTKFASETWYLQYKPFSIIFEDLFRAAFQAVCPLSPSLSYSSRYNLLYYRHVRCNLGSKRTVWNRSATFCITYTSLLTRKMQWIDG